METYTRAEFIDESSHFDFDIKEKEEQPTIHGDYSVEGVEDIEAKGAALWFESRRQLLLWSTGVRCDPVFRRGSAIAEYRG